MFNMIYTIFCVVKWWEMMYNRYIYINHHFWWLTIFSWHKLLCMCRACAARCHFFLPVQKGSNRNLQGLCFLHILLWQIPTGTSPRTSCRSCEVLLIWIRHDSTRRLRTFANLVQKWYWPTCSHVWTGSWILQAESSSHTGENGIAWWSVKRPERRAMAGRRAFHLGSSM